MSIKGLETRRCQNHQQAPSAEEWDPAYAHHEQNKHYQQRRSEGNSACNTKTDVSVDTSVIQANLS